jgi:hypothetical protein
MSDNTRARRCNRERANSNFSTNELAEADSLRGLKSGPPTEAAISATMAAKVGGARRDRTDDLLLAKQALSQLSYGPFGDQVSVISNQDSASDY